MRILTMAILLLFASVTDARSQVRFDDNESFAVTTMISHSKNYEIATSGNIEYRGKIYARIGYEVAATHGEYRAIQSSIGTRVVLDFFGHSSLYGGIQGKFVSLDGEPNPSGGFEIGTDYVFDSGLLIGANISYMYRGDLMAVNLPEVWETHFGVRIGYCWGY